ncbi:hypothetical protein A3H53_01195 [Candidatus Nomurabacteria bacterium RIFCSPLOWO2_02_FULL_40_10]|uniref:Ribosomal RNA small subunit methyltransferase E n=1 Tax=Candidatus Nomurabacteria bacterium RIFCSPLOWO2_02_FULL_40_10 TaxID=1801786 RepID=A0A1F6XWY2_9BACT|nr:MAG: hypothetical protein A3H53_01195 [Candidatus Nomurabacteria bacterium RIFCSPLOWO2_02_FULL_40_10]
MKIHRFIINKDLVEGRLEVVDNELFNQLKNVLRLGVGSKVSLADSKGREALAEIKGFKKGSIELQLQEAFRNDKEPAREVTLYCSVLKRENFELVVQKATEVGVKRIFPLVAERTVKLNLKMERLQKIIKEAAEQSGRAVVPILYEPVSFKGAVTHAKENSLNLFFDISGVSLKKNLGAQKNSIGVFIGPEGGWTAKELESARESKFEIVSLGKLTLRAETAAIVASYIAVNNGI